MPFAAQEMNPSDNAAQPPAEYGIPPNDMIADGRYCLEDVGGDYASCQGAGGNKCGIQSVVGALE